MAEQKDYKKLIAPLNAQAQKEAWPLIGLILLVMVATLGGLYLVGYVSNML